MVGQSGLKTKFPLKDRPETGQGSGELVWGGFGSVLFYWIKISKMSEGVRVGAGGESSRVRKRTTLSERVQMSVWKRRMIWVKAHRRPVRRDLLLEAIQMFTSNSVGSSNRRASAISVTEVEGGTMFFVSLRSVDPFVPPEEIETEVDLSPFREGPTRRGVVERRVVFDRVF